MITVFFFRNDTPNKSMEVEVTTAIFFGKRVDHLYLCLK